MYMFGQGFSLLIQPDPNYVGLFHMSAANKYLL